MKKLLFIFGMCAMLCACNTKTVQSEPVSVDTVEVVDSVVVDSIAVDSAAVDFIM